MIEIEFSNIDTPTPTLQQILRNFEQEHGINVKQRSQTWEGAWRELLMWVLNGQGPDVSQVGSTWAASLMGMNAVLPFKEQFIRSIGGSHVFLPQCWRSAQDSTSFSISSLPWTAYTFVLAYRRDLLERAGVNEQRAFLTAADLLETARALQKAGVPHPWVAPVAPNHVDSLHFIASWVWASGGDFISPDGRRAGFTRPETIEAMTRYFELFRFSGDLPLPWGEDAALDLFLRGDAAMTLVGSNIAYNWLRNNLLPPEFAQNIAFLPVPGVPWIGGDNLIIWKNARMSPERERAALELVAHLIQPTVQELYANGESVALPTRHDSLNTLPLPQHSLTRAISNSLRTGRCYTPIYLWSKIELQLSRTLGEIATQIIQGGDPVTLVREHMSAQASWLEMIL